MSVNKFAAIQVGLACYVESFKHERFFLVLLKPKKNFILEGESHGEH